MFGVKAILKDVRFYAKKQGKDVYPSLVLYFV